jgi:hypothetical protein
MPCSSKVYLLTIASLVSASLATAALPPGYTGTPYKGDTLLGKPQQLPGVVKGIFVDVGGGNVTTQDYSNWDYDCVGYGTNGQLDSSVNATHKTAHLAYMGPGLSAKYTVHVNTAGTYYVDFKLANVGAPPNLITLTYYDGAKVTKDSVKDLPVVKEVTPPPGGVTEIWHNWTVNFKVDSVQLDTGLQLVQIVFAKGAWNYDWMRFRPKSGSGVRMASPVQASASTLKAVSLGNNVLSVTAEAAGPAKISLFDCAGRTVATLPMRILRVGEQAISLPAGRAFTGVYFLRLDQNGRTLETRVVMAR